MKNLFQQMFFPLLACHSLSDGSNSVPPSQVEIGQAEDIVSHVLEPRSTSNSIGEMDENPSGNRDVGASGETDSEHIASGDANRFEVNETNEAANGNAEGESLSVVENNLSTEKTDQRGFSEEAVSNATKDQAQMTSETDTTSQDASFEGTLSFSTEERTKIQRPTDTETSKETEVPTETRTSTFAPTESFTVSPTFMRLPTPTGEGMQTRTETPMPTQTERPSTETKAKESTQNVERCPRNMTLNSEGECVCLDGYQRDENMCFKCNEKCHEKAECVKPGRCKCKEPLAGDGISDCYSLTPKLLGVEPVTGPTGGGTLVRLTLESPIPRDVSVAYCRFDVYVVRAHSASGNVVVCQAPPHDTAMVHVAFSYDRHHWSTESVTYSYKDRNGFLKVLSPLIVAFLVLIVVGAVVLIGIHRLFGKGKSEEGAGVASQSPKADVDGDDTEREPFITRRRHID